MCLLPHVGDQSLFVILGGNGRLSPLAHLERVSREALGELHEGVAIGLAIADENEIQHLVHLIPLGSTATLQELHRAIAVHLEHVGKDALAEVPVALAVLTSEAILLEPQCQGLALVHVAR